MGHPPFSHSGETLCPEERPTHEHYTRDIIADRDSEIRQIIEGEHYRAGIRVDDILPVAVSAELAPPRTAGDTILSALVTGELGVDRIDYLVRDSHHAGVAYGRFDHLRLLNTLRVVRPPDAGQPVLALERGGVQTAESLILARHFMFVQVYKHRVREIYVRPITEFSDVFLAAKPVWEGRIYCDPTDPELRRRIRSLCLERLPNVLTPSDAQSDPPQEQ